MEYRIDVKVRNNIILFKLEQAGYKSIGEYCRINKIMNYVGVIGDIVAMKMSPLQSDGQFRKAILRLADDVNCAPEDLFTDSQLHTILKTNKKSIQVNEAEMKFMIENYHETDPIKLIEDDDLKKTCDYVVGSLTPREQKVVNMRYGLEDGIARTLEECGQVFGINRERVRQIEAKALRKLRHPSRAEQLRQFVKNGPYSETV